MKNEVLVSRVAYLCTLLLGAAAWWIARGFPRPEEAHSGPGSFPQALGLVMIGLSLAGLYVTFKEPAGGSAQEEPAQRGRAPWVALALATAAYLVLMPWLGFISGTALLFTGSLWLLGYRRLAPALAIGFLFAFGLYVVFGIIMNVPLPEGWLG